MIMLSNQRLWFIFIHWDENISIHHVYLIFLFQLLRLSCCKSSHRYRRYLCIDKDVLRYWINMGKVNINMFREKSRISSYSYQWLLARLYEVQGELLESPRLSAFPSHCDKILFPSFPKVHISTATHQKAFIFGPYVPWRADFHSMIHDPRVDAPGWG